jgi:ABC-2 type transport system permease protein
MISWMQKELRIILAIASKDIVDAIKNKSILSQVLTVAFIIVFYRFLPAFDSGDELPRLALYDAGNSELVVALEHSAALKLVEFSTQEGMRAYIEDGDIVVLGLALPPELDSKIDAGELVELEGYLVHWASERKSTEAKDFFEAEIEQITGLPIQINTEGNDVYSIPNSRGLSYLVSLSAVLALIIAGAFIVPILMLEEKQNKTLDALLVSPADPKRVVLAKALSGSIYCAMAIAAVLVINHTLVTQWGLALLAAGCGVLFAVGVGLLLGSAFELKQQLTLWGFMLINILGIPMFLSIMIDILPAGMLTVINLLPTVALMGIFQASFSKDATLGIFGPDLVIVLVGTVVVYAAVVWFIQREDR